jgi:hypothetical protein
MDHSAIVLSYAPVHSRTAWQTLARIAMLLCAAAAVVSSGAVLWYAYKLRVEIALWSAWPCGYPADCIQRQLTGVFVYLAFPAAMCIPCWHHRLSRMTARAALASAAAGWAVCMSL